VGAKAKVSRIRRNRIAQHIISLNPVVSQSIYYFSVSEFQKKNYMFHLECKFRHEILLFDVKFY